MLKPGVISSAFFNLQPTTDVRNKIESLFRTNGLEFLIKHFNSIVHLPLGMKWCLKHNITNLDILVTGSLFKVLLPEYPERPKDLKADDLGDGFEHGLYEDNNIQRWAEQFRKLIAVSTKFAKADLPTDKNFSHPSLATNFPNISFHMEDHEKAMVLWKRSVFALASCLVAAHLMDIRVVEIVAGSVLDKRLYKLERDTNTTSTNHWKIQLFPNYEKARSNWKLNFAKGIWSAFVLARNILTKEEDKSRPVWPDCLVAIELEPEPFRLANHPREILSLIEETSGYILDNYEEPIDPIFQKNISPARDCEVTTKEAKHIADKIGVNLDIGHVAMLLQKSSNINSISLEEQTMEFLYSNSPSSCNPILNEAEKENFWEKIFHSHLSDHGLIHNKDQVPLDMLPKEFYVNILKQYENRPENGSRTKCVALELEAASTTGEIGAGYHYILEMLDAV